MSYSKRGVDGKANMTIAEAFDAYALDVIVFSNQSKKTEENHRICQRALISYFGDIPMESLTFAMVRDWKLNLDKHRSAETVRNYIIKLRVVLAYLKARGINCLDPSTIPVPKRGDKVPDFISKDIVSDLITAVGKPMPGYARQNRLRNQALISLLYASGVRVSELCALDRDSLHDASFTIIGKGHKARLCFYDERTHQLLTAYLSSRTDNNPALFISFANGQRITAGNVQEIFRLARKKAHLSIPVHPHTLRHSFATDFLRNNGNMRYLQALLGHASLETTQMYSHVVDLDLEKAYKEHHTV